MQKKPKLRWSRNKKSLKVCTVLSEGAYCVEIRGHYCDCSSFRLPTKHHSLSRVFAFLRIVRLSNISGRFFLLILRKLAVTGSLERVFSSRC